eukprot:TRINITY_DN64153_c0_g2_i1.p2 TRINITY_DN64153_c0_g2~~TRINITY_DN64153_c0_g2_i1.p2  ORF type:complete len:139 (-),score=77.04 TRINITY_DN64153_c0_g2_i1:55-432(-)
MIMSRDARRLVVEPIERMTKIVRKLAGTVFFLSAGSDEGYTSGHEQYETAVIESLVDKMANIFNVGTQQQQQQQREALRKKQADMHAKQKDAPNLGATMVEENIIDSDDENNDDDNKNAIINHPC